MRNVFDRGRLLRRVPIAVLAGLIAVGPGGTVGHTAKGAPSLHSLRDYRGERLVLLVQYTLPESRPRLTDLALDGVALDLPPLEIILHPSGAAAGLLRPVGHVPPPV